MLNVAEAQQAVEGYLRRKYTHSPHELVIMTSRTREEDFGWVFFFNTRQFVETGDLSFALGGNTPLIVDKDTGEIHVTGTALPTEHYIDAYRRKRGGTRS